MKNSTKIFFLTVLSFITSLSMTARVIENDTLKGAKQQLLGGVTVQPFSTVNAWTEVKDGSIEQSKYGKTKVIARENMIAHCERFKDIIVKDFDMECFLVGTLDDYSGRSSRDDTVDLYLQQEKPLTELINTLFGSVYGDLHTANNNAPKGLTLHSEKLAGVVNAYYDYASGVGVLKADKFLSGQQKLSFIAGAILREGILKTDVSGVYYIAFPNSLSKAELCERFLHELGCRDMEYHIMHGYIPTGHKVFFKPSPKIHEIIQEFEKAYGKGVI